jgi:hypothetical protein
MTTDNFCFYLQNRLIQASQTGSQRYSDANTFSIPCSKVPRYVLILLFNDTKLLKTQQPLKLEKNKHRFKILKILETVWWVFDLIYKK